MSHRVGLLLSCLSACVRACVCVCVRAYAYAPVLCQLCTRRVCCVCLQCTHVCAHARVLCCARACVLCVRNVCVCVCVCVCVSACMSACMRERESECVCVCVCVENQLKLNKNQLKLNDDKTEALLFPFSSSLKPSTGPLPDSITLGTHNIPFSDSARNLGFILDSKLSMKKHIIKICQTAYFELKRISSFRRFLTEDATNSCYFLHPFTAWLLQLSPYGYT